MPGYEEIILFVCIAVIEHGMRSFATTGAEGAGLAGACRCAGT